MGCVVVGIVVGVLLVVEKWVRIEVEFGCGLGWIGFLVEMIAMVVLLVVVVAVVADVLVEAVAEEIELVAIV